MRFLSPRYLCRPLFPCVLLTILCVDGWPQDKPKEKEGAASQGKIQLSVERIPEAPGLCRCCV